MINKPDIVYLIVKSFVYTRQIDTTTFQNTERNYISKSYRKYFYAKRYFDEESHNTFRWISNPRGSLELLMVKVENGVTTTQVLERKEWK